MESIAVNRKNQKKFTSRVAKIKGQLKKGIEVKANIPPKTKVERGVVYLGHIPHGFYEDEIRAYCSQFGKVTRVRVARSKKTGRSKGYAFVEFQHPEVANIVAETINNYLMFNRILSCHYIPPDKRHSKMFWRGITASKFPAKKNRELDTMRKNGTQDLAKEDEKKRKKRRKIEDFKKFFEERGIEFNFKVNDPSDDLNTVVEKTPAVLEIDESDDEVEFNTPPNVLKVFKNKKTVGTPNSTSKIYNALAQTPARRLTGSAKSQSKKPASASKQLGSKGKVKKAITQKGRR